MKPVHHVELARARLPDTSWNFITEVLAEVRRHGSSALSALDGGGMVERFELAFADLTGARHALAVSSGQAALHTALLACDISAGDEVIVSPYGWGQTTGAVLAVGATPVFADIDSESGNLDPASVASRLGPRTRAVLVTHVHGLPADMAALRALCHERGILLLADAAQALGSTFAGEGIASLADLSCFSLGQGKVISTGEGGMIATSDPALLERMLLVSQHPRRCFREVESPDYFSSITEFGFSYRFNPLAAAIGLGQIDEVGVRIANRRELARSLSNRLLDIQGIYVPGDHGDARHSYHHYVIRCAGTDRAAVVDELCKRGIALAPAAIRSPLHMRHPFNPEQGAWYPKAGMPRSFHPTWQIGSCPVAERRCYAGDIYLRLE